MRTFTTILVLFIASFAVAQTQDQCPSCTVLGGHLTAGGGVILGNFGGVVTGGWTYLQASGPFTLGSDACSGASCTFGILPTTAGSVWALQVETPSANNVTISAANGWSTAAGACHVNDATSGFNLDSAYQLSGAGGTTSISLTLSATGGSSYFPLFVELLPPPGFTASFDGCATAAIATCTTCTAAAPAVSATDAISHIIQPQHGGLAFNNAFQWAGSPTGYAATEFLGNGWGIGLNVSSATPAVFNQSSAGYFDDSAISFKSTAGIFVPTPTNVFSIVQAPANGANQECAPTCTASGIPVVAIPSTIAGDLGVIMVTNTTSGHYISSVSGCGTWVVPAGAQVSQSGIGAVSMAYTLSLTGACTTATITMNSNDTALNTWVAYAEISRNDSKSFILDVVGATDNSTTSQTPPGQTLTLSGTSTDPDICFQQIENGANASVLPFTQTLYFQPAYGGGSNQNATNYGSNAILLNTLNGAAPKWWLEPEVAVATVVDGMCFK